MSIYPDRNRAGELTGKFKVELQYQGKRMRGTFPTLPEAQQMEQQWRKDLVSTPTVPQAPKSTIRTLGDLCDKCCPVLWQGNSAEVQTIARCKQAVALIGPSTPLSSLSVGHIDSLAATLAMDKAPATVNRYLSALHRMLEWAYARKLLASVPEFPWNHESEGRIRWITEDEEHRLLGALGSSPVALVVRVAIATGLRRNELLGLSLKDVEPDWIRLWKTKNETPRSVPITPETHALLLQLFKVGMPTVFQLRYAWERAAEDIGLGDDPLFVFHACRHTCATRLIQANVNLRIVQRWLGHKRIETTLRYAHVNDTMLTDALGQFSSHQDIRRVA